LSYFLSSTTVFQDLETLKWCYLFIIQDAWRSLSLYGIILIVHSSVQLMTFFEKLSKEKLEVEKRNSRMTDIITLIKSIEQM